MSFQMSRMYLVITFQRDTCNYITRLELRFIFYSLTAFDNEKHLLVSLIFYYGKQVNREWKRISSEIYRINVLFLFYINQQRGIVLIPCTIS